MTEAYTVTKLSPMRWAIATRTTEAKQTIPHFRLVADIEVDALIGLRKVLQTRNPETRVSLNDLLIKACASALMDVPAVNSQWVEGEIHQYRAADISVVTAVEGGLATPIVRRAESKTIWEISREVKALAAQAARNALKISEIAGGTFSVSNLGMYGVDQFDAIINPPQCAILAIGRARPRWVAAAEDEFGHAGSPRFVNVLTVTLSADHRAIDGATGAAFLAALRRHVEQPEYMHARDGD